MTLNEIGRQAKEVSRLLGILGSREKNMGLEEAARSLLEGEEEILLANQEDCEKAKNGGMSQGLLDRLMLTPPGSRPWRTVFCRWRRWRTGRGSALPVKRAPTGCRSARSGCLWA